ncbi:hypothetical protein RBV54_002475 [Salmonella enterica]|nr:hypothetical protein [Salmonella enterica subsp. enterica serovar Aqua]EJA5988191.1 hypothetical protein [Salmonella enterica]EJX4927921.1 hypothetical protein [Salmonella enterica]ELE9458819.1 hypothetical protein [Salmonella enterica]ELF7040112.1 hypothetical protein [Salmonella enterica]
MTTFIRLLIQLHWLTLVLTTLTQRGTVEVGGKAPQKQSSGQIGTVADG